jgi:hypothetical protein
MKKMRPLPYYWGAVARMRACSSGGRINKLPGCDGERADLRRGRVGGYNKPRSLSKMTMRMITTRRPIIPGTFASFVDLFS